MLRKPPDPRRVTRAARSAALRICGILMLALVVSGAGGCATLRVTDPARTADEEFLLSEAAGKAIAQLSMDPLRGRMVWLVSGYAFSTTQPYDQSFLTNQIREPDFQSAFMVAELRARLLQAGVRLAANREQADVILEVRAGALSINRIDFLLGVPAIYVPNSGNNNNLGAVVLSTPDLSLYRSIRQQGFASIAYVAYWKNTGELLAISGPFVGRTFRTDYFIFGYALPPVGNIPPTQVGATPGTK